jgi:hypothetical protein
MPTVDFFLLNILCLYSEPRPAKYVGQDGAADHLSGLCGPTPPAMA